MPLPPSESLARYDAMCDRAAAQVIGRYSTSFSLAARFLSAGVRRDISNLYAMVRVADEIVDGVAADAGQDARLMLDAYEKAVVEAPTQRFHTDPVLHAWAATARRCNFDPAHVSAFFASMRRDTSQTSYSEEDFSSYVYGSGEVIGLMCLDAFVPGGSRDARLAPGARALGSAFQKINFLRDYGSDSEELGRRYFPGVSTLDDATKAALVNDIRSELATARRAIALLPLRARPAVAAAEALFRELTDRIDVVPAAQLAETRVSVPAARKAQVTAAAALRATRGRLDG